MASRPNSSCNNNKSLWDDDDDEEDCGKDDEDVVPLVAANEVSASSSRGRRQQEGRRQLGNSSTTKSGTVAPASNQMEMAVFRRKRHGRDFDEDDDGEDMFTSTNNSNNRRRSWLSMCWSDTWRLLASCFLAMLLFVPLTKRWYRQNHQNQQQQTQPQPNEDNEHNEGDHFFVTFPPTASPFASPASSSSSASSFSHKWPSDDATCAKETYQIQFSTLFDQISRAGKDPENDTEPTLSSTSLSSSSSSSSPFSFCKRGIPNDQCKCANPTIPSYPRKGRRIVDFRSWNLTFTRNLDLIQYTLARQMQQPLDVVLLGDSITERWLGTHLTFPIPRVNSSLYLEVFQQLFNNTTPDSSSSNNNNNNDKKTTNANHTSSLRGLPLGIAGDRIPQLLYRMQHGEVTHFQSTPPKVWWILIGINDLLGTGCSKETVLVGLIRIIQELQQHRQQQQQQQQQSSSWKETTATFQPTTSWIVINSLLPCGDWRVGKNQDSWVQTSWIHERLECYIKGFPPEERLVFFNATNLFLVPNQQQQQPKGEAATSTIVPWILNETLFVRDLLHLSPAGQRVWGEAIVKKVLELLITTS